MPRVAGPVTLMVALAPLLGETLLLVNSTMPLLPGMDVMSSSKYPHIGIIERVSRTELKWHRHRRQVIAGPVYEWHSYEIPYTIWGGDCKFYRYSFYYFQ
ncbi:unnamed protein product [Gongylonema pulchrum]|uniref:Secreted protein n=1 Tax=Gongylonema pulchrum TaxID=637853 RepID=A0A183D1Y4_9BILA|nr:unnamed protein product [Gongylonema pulchrum]